jgi:prepilin-type N-terminal cleavage/methylation domain-containing protein
MTLVEVMVAMAIIAVVAVIFVSGFYTMSGVTAEGARMTGADEDVERSIASGGAPDESSALELTLSGGAIGSPNISGHVREYSADGQSFRVFVPDDL